MGLFRKSAKHREDNPPSCEAQTDIPECESCFVIDDTCDIGKNGVVMVSGTAAKGSFSKGDAVRVQSAYCVYNTKILGIGNFSRHSSELECENEFIALMLEGLTKEQLHKGDFVLK